MSPKELELALSSIPDNERQPTEQAIKTFLSLPEESRARLRCVIHDEKVRADEQARGWNPY